jgi:hypothetical protein
MKPTHQLRWVAGIGFATLFTLFMIPALLPHGPISWFANNPRYTLWRLGLYPYNDRIVYQGLIGDVWADDLVRGKTVTELRERFHDIRDISQFDSVSVAKVAEYTNSTCTFLKWGDHDLFIEITNGCGDSLHLWKG